MSRVQILRQRQKLPQTIALSLDDATPSVEQDDSAAVFVLIDRRNCVADLAVSVTGLPTGVTAVVTPSPATARDTGVTVVLTAADDAPTVTADPFTIEVTGTGVPPARLLAAVTVTAPTLPQSITITPDDDIVSVQQNGTVDIIYTLARAGGYTGTVTLATTNLPTGVSASYPNGQTYTGGDTTKTVRLTATGAAPLVTDVTFTVTATGTGVTASANDGTVTVITPAPPVGYVPISRDDFTGYADTTALQAVLTANSFYASDSISKTLAEIDSTVTYNGRNTLKLLQPIGSATPQLVKRWTPTYSNIWAKEILQFPTGYRLDGTPTTYAESYKLMGFEFANGVSRSIFAFSYNDLQLEGRAAGTQSAPNPQLPYFGTIVRTNPAMFDSSKWWTFVNHYVVNATHHLVSRGWVYEDGQLPSTGHYVTLSIKDHRSTISPAKAFLLHRNFNLTRDYAQQVNVAEWEAVDNDAYPDPYALGANVDTIPSISVSMSDVSVARGGSTPVTVTITRNNGFNGTVYCRAGTDKFGDSRPDPLLPSGVTMAYSPTTMVAGVNSTTLTFTATAGATPGTTQETIYVSGQWNNGRNVHASNDYVTINLTVT